MEKNKYALIMAPKNYVFCTSGVLQYLMKINGLELAEEKDANILLFSGNDLSDFELILRYRKDKRLKILGGLLGFYYKLLCHYVDFIVIGEGFEFFRGLGNWEKEGKDIRDFLGQQPYIYFKGKKTVTPSTEIFWDEIPIVKSSKKMNNFLLSRGCKRKCKFCFPSHVTPFSINPFSKNIEKIFRAVGKERITLVSNELFDTGISLNILQKCAKQLSTQSLSAQAFVTRFEEFKFLKLVRLGIEFATEEMRREMGKPISDEKLRKIVDLTNSSKQEQIWFLILGLNTFAEWEDFIKNIPEDFTCCHPRIFIKPTGLEPAGHTPLRNFDMRKYIYFNYTDLGAKLANKNGRIRAYWPTKKLVNIFYKVFMSRAIAIDEVNWIKAWHKENLLSPQNDPLVYCRDAEKAGFPELVDSFRYPAFFSEGI